MGGNCDESWVLGAGRALTLGNTVFFSTRTEFSLSLVKPYEPLHNLSIIKGFYGLFNTGAIEKQKLVYILNRDAAARLTISSPLEAHKANTLVYHVVGVDVGFENPMFACLEMDYEVRMQLVLLNILYTGVIACMGYKYISHYITLIVVFPF